MECALGRDKSRELAVGYTARTLDTPERAEFQRHLATCHLCAAAVAEQKAVWDALDGWRDVGVSADFDRRLRARIAADRPVANWWVRCWRPALPVAVAAMLLGVVFWVNQPRESEVAPRPVHVSSELSPDPSTGVPAQVESLQHALNDMDMLGQLSPM
jgi:hypothetical protein